MEKYSHWAMDMPFSKGQMVRQGDADYCAEFGHTKYWIIDGVEQGLCARCGAVK